ncbi:uncharacterized protein LOC131942642 [Physella acuta]|uniref:uncharacterized protein LOC131942642 n=1 Tax=Physella acuta TaxID=109671 RepID=UPI0027DBA60E|nr:uncharacterized protein LOC131942642 [Physella acuta]
MMTWIALLLVGWALKSSEAASPTLEDIAAIECPSERPNICLPYGLCCKDDAFCHAGQCEDCFPAGVNDLLTWCRTHGIHNVSVMRSPLCRLACQARYDVTELVASPDSKKSDVALYCMIAVAIFFVLYSLGVSVLGLKMYRRERNKIYAPVDQGWGEQDKNASKKNKKDSIVDVHLQDDTHLAADDSIGSTTLRLFTTNPQKDQTTDNDIDVNNGSQIMETEI